jgi:hypothetical protein
MSRKRKAVARPIDAATEHVVWRARIVCEFLEGSEGDNQLLAAVRHLEHAIEDYEVSRPSSRQGQLELQA